MCGIVGAVSLDRAQPVDPRALDRMCRTLVHRGPDESGQVVEGPFGLAMRRLSIIDVAGGHQPLAGEDGAVQVVCNGEIYNHRDLRRELEGLGHRFRTASDCEVLVHGYEAWGDALLGRLNGMFAVALWDGRRGRLLLARDRVGIKPLYWAQDRGFLLFASEPKAILAWPGFRRALDPVALDRYLTLEYVPAPRSIYRGIARLRPGHRLRLEAGAAGPVEEPWWEPDLRPDPALAAAPARELAERLWQTLAESVRMELMSDVPLGVFLSGGIDSSAVARAATEHSAEVRTFSIAFEDRSFDESPWARMVAATVGSRHHELTLEPRLLSDLVPRVMGFLDEPFADPSVLPTHLLSRFTREHVKVALGGDGGDELFAGYPTLQAHRLARLYLCLPAPLRRRLLEPLGRRLPVSHSNLSLDFRLKAFLRGLPYPPAERHHVWLGAFAPEEKAAILAPDLGRELAATPTFALLDEHLARTTELDPMSRILYLDMKLYLEGDILTKVDRASMGCSLEVRVPLLNNRMLDFALPLPFRHKMRRMTRKHLLRIALRGRLPQAVIDRPKKGFGIPVGKWLRGELQGLMRDLLAPDRIRGQGLFRPEAVERLVADHLGGRRDNRKPLWTLLVFQLWHQRWLEEPPAPGPD